MNWYITKVVFAITADNSSDKRQFDEQLRLVQGESREEAFMKARMIGLGEEDCFYNDKMKQVKWEFINVSEVLPLKTIEDGIEVYSRIHETEEGKSYINFVHQKAIALRLNELPLF
ncbi:MAG TPA: DUF4288 domain-containing protein [Chryseolinea sp.]|nr:DUF4288 domain-containing protein [Chryseolinea sp.]